MRFGVVHLSLVLAITACGNVNVQAPGGAVTPQSLGGSGNPQQPTSTGAAVLTWDPVTKDTSGNPLQHLGGYKIRYGTSAHTLNTVETQNDPNATTYIINNLPQGTWYFTVSAYTTEDIESAPSNVASKTIN